MSYPQPTFTTKLVNEARIKLILDYDNGFTIAQNKIIPYVKNIIDGLNNYKETGMHPHLPIIIGSDDILTAFSLAVLEDAISEYQIVITNKNKDFTTKFNHFGKISLTDEERSIFPGLYGTKDKRLIAEILYKQNVKNAKLTVPECFSE